MAITETINTNVKKLMNEKIWQYFVEITQIPRPTFHEKKIKLYLLSWAQKNDFKVVLDKADNIVIHVPASKGFESHQVVALQAHRDMVCEKHKEVNFDFIEDALQLKIQGKWLKATGTTLGADNGIGIAAAMAIASDLNIKRPALEILITASEERGLIGANNLSKNLLNAKKMINLDTESWGDIYVGCAGSQFATIELETPLMEQQENSKSNKKIQKSIEIVINGLKGGHSGLDIDKSRVNAAKFMGSLLIFLNQNYQYNLSELEAGNLPNAIPREARAVISCEKDNLEILKLNIKNYFNEWYNVYQQYEPDFSLNINEVRATSVFSNSVKLNLLNLLSGIHSGVLAMSSIMPNLVESSNNLSSIKLENGKIVLTIYTRSDNDLAIRVFMEAMQHLAVHNQAKFRVSELSPGWKPNMNSELLKIAKDSYVHLYKSEACVKAIHAGLECGAIINKYPCMDVISIGPSIEGAHSPNEKVEIETVEKFYYFLKEIVERL